MDKLERLLNLTAALLHADSPLTAETLRDRVGGYPEQKASFRRTFERDKDDLRAMGIPLRVETVPGVDPPVDGYRLDRREYAGTDLRFDPDELAALHLATSLVRLDGSDDALVKLGAAAPGAEVDHLGRIPFDDSLADLIGAAAERRQVKFMYNEEARSVEPWRVSFARGYWYLSAWDCDREDDRLFRVDRIGSAIAVGDDATHPVGSGTDPNRLRSWELGDQEPIVAQVRIDTDQASFARHLIDDVVEDDDGSATATLRVRNRAGFRAFVLSFLDHAEVLSPKELRDDFVSWLEAQR